MSCIGVISGLCLRHHSHQYRHHRGHERHHHPSSTATTIITIVLDVAHRRYLQPTATCHQPPQPPLPGSPRLHGINFAAASGLGSAADGCAGESCDCERGASGPYRPLPAGSQLMYEHRSRCGAAKQRCAAKAASKREDHGALELVPNGTVGAHYGVMRASTCFVGELVCYKVN